MVAPLRLDLLILAEVRNVDVVFTIEPKANGIWRSDDHSH